MIGGGLVPKRYAVTRRYLELAACAVFGIDPRSWPDVPRDLAAELIGFALVRREEEARMAGAGIK